MSARSHSLLACDIFLLAAERKNVCGRVEAGRSAAGWPGQANHARHSQVSQVQHIQRHQVGGRVEVQD